VGLGQTYPAAIAGAVFFLVASLFAGSYYDARFLLIFLALGLLTADRKSRQRALASSEGRAGTLTFDRSAMVDAATGAYQQMP
jgi:hypothetical protein